MGSMSSLGRCKIWVFTQATILDTIRNMPKKNATRKPTKKRPASRSLDFSIVIFSLSCVLFFAVLFLFLTAGKRSMCANSISCIKDLSGKYENAQEGVFMGKKVDPVRFADSNLSPKRILGENTNSTKHIYVDLTSQHLYANENGKVVFDFPVSTGKWYKTPTGDFRIWIKLRYTRMSGGNSPSTYYNLPNVPYTMFFYNEKYPKHVGYGLHGAYWHNNFGHPMSHGCVNISIENAETLYNWANPVTGGYTTYATDENPGTALTIYGETPKE